MNLSRLPMMIVWLAMLGAAALFAMWLVQRATSRASSAVGL